MRIFSNKNNGKSDIFGDKVEKMSEQLSNPSWLEQFARKQSSQDVPSDSGDFIRNRVLGSHQVDRGGHIGSLNVKSASDTLFGQKDPPAPKAAKSKKTDDVAEIIEEPLPTSAERLSTHVASTSASAAGRGMIRADSVSLFDKDPFSHIKNREKPAPKIAERAVSSPRPAMGSRSLAENMFDKLTSPKNDRNVSSSDVGAVSRMFDALKSRGES
jgi:hypothetical protein